MENTHPLREWRKRQRPWWSGKYLAEVSGVPYWAIARIESGLPVAQYHLEALARTTGLYRDLGLARPKGSA